MERESSEKGRCEAATQPREVAVDRGVRATAAVAHKVLQRGAASRRRLAVPGDGVARRRGPQPAATPVPARR